MRVAIITFYQAVNAGAYLQQYALDRVLRSIGCDVEILRYQSNFFYRELKSRFHRHSGFKRFSAMFEATSYWFATHRDFKYSPTVKSAEKFDWSRYDAVVFGSDEIWNVTNWFSGYCPILFGKGIKSKRKISYAPSFGEVSQVTQLPSEVSSLLEDFHSISVRDTNSAALVRNVSTRDVHLCLDPTLIYPFASELAARPAMSPNALIVYATQVEPMHRDSILKYAAKFGLKVVALGYPQDWVDLDASDLHPLQTLSEFNAANTVITNTFHGVALSIKFSKPFILQAMDGKSHKISSLLNSFRIELSIPPAPLEWAVGFSGNEPSGWASVVQREREASLIYLRDALSSN